MSFAMIEDYDKRIENDEEIELEKSRNYYETKCEDLKSKMKEIVEKHENQLMEERRMFSQMLEQKDKEIEWYKSVINGILHI